MIYVIIGILVGAATFFIVGPVIWAETKDHYLPMPEPAAVFFIGVASILSGVFWPATSLALLIWLIARKFW